MSGMDATVSVPQVSARAKDHRRVHLLGMPIDALSEAETLGILTDRLNRREGTWVVTPNLDILRQYHRTPALRAMFESADIFLADGMPLIWASRIAKLNGRGLAGASARVGAGGDAGGERGGTWVAAVFAGRKPGRGGRCG